MPNMDPRALKSMMERMGIRSDEVDAEEVLIKCRETTIRITNPTVTRISAQGNISFQVSGSISQFDNVRIEINEEDIKMVMENTGASETEVRSVLEETNGDIAEAIVRLKKQ